jgi:hypothetical protein
VDPLLLISGLAALGVAVGSAVRQRFPEALAREVAGALLDPGDDLSSPTRRVRQALDLAFLARLGAGRRRSPRHQPDARERALRLLRALVAIERGELPTAEAELTRCGDADEARLIALRVALARGTEARELPPLPPQASALPSWLLEDTHALLRLLEGDTRAARPLGRLPSTLLRALVADGAEAEAALLLARMAPARIEALCRLAPSDPATLFVAARRQAAPYR